MSDLSSLVAALKREVATPGTFETVYPNTTDEDLIGALMDAYASAQLDGFFLAQVLDVATHTVTPDLSMAGGALIVAYAAERMITAQILNLRQRVRYEAGPVRYEIENSTYVLVQLLKNVAERRKLLMATGQSGGGFAMGDLFTDRAYPWNAASAVGESADLVMYSYEAAAGTRVI